MSLNEGCYAIGYLVKSTGKTSSEVMSLVKDYDFRDTHNKLSSDPQPYDDNIKKALSWLKSKSIGTSTLLAKWSSYCYNLQSEYTDMDDLLHPKPQFTNEISTQEDLDALERSNWRNTSIDSFTVHIRSSRIPAIDWRKVSIHWVLSESEVLPNSSDIIGDSMVKLSFVKGVSLLGWDGITIPRKGVLYPKEVERLSVSYRQWPEEAASDEVKAEEVKAEEVKAEEVKAEEVKAEEVKAEEVKAEEVKAEEVKAEEVKAEEVKAEEVKAEEVKAEEVKAEEVKAESTNQERGYSHEQIWNFARKGISLAVPYGEAYTTVTYPVTSGDLWPELLMGAAVLGGCDANSLKSSVPTSVWVLANSETKGFSQSSKPGDFAYDALAKRVNTLVHSINMVR